MATYSLCAMATDRDNLFSHRIEIDADACQRFGRVAAAQLNQSEENMLCADEVMVQ